MDHKYWRKPSTWPIYWARGLEKRLPRRNRQNRREFSCAFESSRSGKSWLSSNDDLDAFRAALEGVASSGKRKRDETTKREGRTNRSRRFSIPDCWVRMDVPYASLQTKQWGVEDEVSRSRVSLFFLSLFPFHICPIELRDHQTLLTLTPPPPTRTPVAHPPNVRPNSVNLNLKTLNKWQDQTRLLTRNVLPEWMEKERRRNNQSVIRRVR